MTTEKLTHTNLSSLTLLYKTGTKEWQLLVSIIFQHTNRQSYNVNSTISTKTIK